MSTDLEIVSAAGEYPLEAQQAFDFSKLDAFHAAEVLSVMFGDAWRSVLITSGENAFLHTYVPQKIAGSPYSDIEPFIGYAGPVLNTGDVMFSNAAIERYRQHCREAHIVAELFRFQPFLGNHHFFELAGVLSFIASKEIVICDCLADRQAQLASFSETCRRRLRRGEASLTFRKLHKTDEWLFFRNIYQTSITRVQGSAKWLMSEPFFDRAQASSRFVPYGVYDGETLVSACLVLVHPTAAYYLLAANLESPPAGASELLIFGALQSLAQMGVSRFILGGGNSEQPDDSLLRFKKKFDNRTHKFVVAGLIHSPLEFRTLIDQAITLRPNLADRNFFLKYRLLENS